VVRWLVLTLLAFTGCTLFVDVDGLSGSAARAGGDASTTGSGDSGAAGADANPGPRADGGGDGPATACVPGPGVFCDSFDDAPLGARWTSKSEVAGAVSLDGTTTVSPPRALRADVNGDGEAFLSLVLPGLPSHVRCELDMNLGEPPSGAVEVLTLITHGGPSNDYQLYVVHNASGWLLAEFGALGGSVDRSAPIASMPIGRWMHVVLDTDGSSVSLSLDGSVAATLASVRSPAGIDRRINVGITYVAKPVTYSVLYDNVVCTYGP